MSKPGLEPLRRPRRRVTYGRLAARFNPGIREVMGSVEPFARAWDRQNRSALQTDGPLLVALGDSSAQGVGASRFDRGFVGLIHRRLREETGEPWRVLNLSMSGGRFADVFERQLPMLEQVGADADLVTCVVGSNDVIWRLRTGPVLDDARRFVRSMPSGSVLSLVARTPNNRERRVEVNEILEDESAARGLHSLQIWKWPAPEGTLASDNFHPSDHGYEHMAELLWQTLEASSLIEEGQARRRR